MSPQDVRGRVYRTSRGTWCYVVLLRGTVVMADNTGAWKPMYEACVKSTAAVRRVYQSGHPLAPWYKILERAGV